MNEGVPSKVFPPLVRVIWTDMRPVEAVYLLVTRLLPL